jgi:hypothetical protein
LGEQPLFDRLGALLKNLCSRLLSTIDFSGFVVGRNAAKNGKTRCLPAVTTKNCFFRKWGEISGLGIYASLCELMEGIVTVSH